MLLPNSITKGGLAVLLACLALAAQAKPLLMSTAPTQSVEEARALYEPIARYLSQATGQEIVFEPVSNYMRYNRMMQDDGFDLLFDGPHFVGWRMEKFGHKPLVRFPGEIRIVVAVKEEGPKELAGLDMGQKVCAFASPNMLTMAFLKYFPNPSRQPHLLRVQNFPEVMKCLREGEGEAAIFRDKIWAKMEQTGLRLLQVPEHGYPERTLTVSSRVDAAMADRVRQALLSDEGTKVAEKLLTRFKKKSFVRADPGQYQGLDRLLAPVWGF